MLSKIASFTGGTYRIATGLSTNSAATAGAHEEAHGIIRRSTLYGCLLSLVENATVVTSGTHATAHSLFSRGRSSEEVFATFFSITLAKLSGYLDVESVELERFPEYRYYYEIGRKLTAGINSDFIKNIIIDGVIRFCWCSSSLVSILRESDNFLDVRSLPATAFPDRRMFDLLERWEHKDVQQIFLTLKVKFPRLDQLSRMSFAEMYDPLYQLKQEFQGKDVMFLGFDEQERLAHMMSVSIASLQERAVMHVMDFLVAKYKDTQLCAEASETVLEIIHERRKAHIKNNSSIQDPPPILEQLENLSEKKTVRVQPWPSWNPGERSIIVGIRTWNSLTENFNVPAQWRNSQDGSAEARYFLGEDVALDGIEEISTDKPEGSTLYLAVPMSIIAMIGGIVAVWASWLLQDTERHFSYCEKLAALGNRIWVVVDVSPKQAIDLVRLGLSEVNAFFSSSGPLQPNVGGLVVRGLDPNYMAVKSFFQGAVFSGYFHTLQIVLRSLKLELGDCFRGMASIDFGSYTAQSRADGESLVKWLFTNERHFSFKEHI